MQNNLIYSLDRIAYIFINRGVDASQTEKFFALSLNCVIYK